MARLSSNVSLDLQHRLSNGKSCTYAGQTCNPQLNGGITVAKDESGFPDDVHWDTSSLVLSDCTCVYKGNTITGTAHGEVDTAIIVNSAKRQCICTFECYKVHRAIGLGPLIGLEQNAMQAIVFKNTLEVAVETRPRPQVQDSTDVILKIRYSALCGSELHVYRGHQPSGTGFIMGHEFTGEVVETGSGVQNFKPGDRVVSPFTVSCGECFFCARGFSSRCKNGKLFGTAILDGGQAEYVRVPLADSTLVMAPSHIDEKKLVLMADIFPTGYFAAMNAFRGLKDEEIRESTVLLFGCGPVGICALISALEYKPKNLLAIDSVKPRLQLANEIGAEPWNFQEDGEGLKRRVAELTEGRGADIVIEVVGRSEALRMGFDNLRPWGRISSVGVHNGEIPWTGNEAYGKNLQISMGRCPVRSIFEDALKLLVKKQDGLDFMVQDIRSLSQGVEAFTDFNQMKSQKIIFDLTENP